MDVRDMEFKGDFREWWLGIRAKVYGCVWYILVKGDRFFYEFSFDCSFWKDVVYLYKVFCEFFELFSKLLNFISGNVGICDF